MICVVVEELHNAAADAIVRPAKSRLEPLTDEIEALDRAAGERFKRDLAVTSELAAGSAVVTDAGELNADLVVHAVLCSSADPLSVKTLRRATRSILHRAIAWQIETIAVPPLGIRGAEPDLEAVARGMFEELSEQPDDLSFPTEFRIVVATDEEKKLFDRMSLGVLG